MNKFKILLPVVIILGFALGACQALPSAQQPNPGDTARQTISVESSGIVALTPDLVRISIGVVTEDSSIQQAVLENNQQVEQIMAVLEELGIPAEDIQTINFRVYQPQNKEPRLESMPSLEESSEEIYVVNNTIRVTMTEVDRLGIVLDKVIKSGANTIQDIQFDASQKEDANRQALEQAVRDARAKAETIAESAGVKLGELVSVETYGGGPVTRIEYDQAETTSAAVPVSEGQLIIQVNVRVSYSIK